MTDAPKIAALQRITDMVFDARLAQVRTAAAHRAHTLAQLAALQPQTAQLGDGQDVGDALAALHYQAWAEARRAQLRQQLALQTAQWMDAQDAARQAFGKANAMGEILRHTKKSARGGEHSKA